MSVGDQDGATPFGKWSALWPYRGRIFTALLCKILAIALALSIPPLLGFTIDALSGENAQNLVPKYALAMVGIGILSTIAIIAARVFFLNAGLEAYFDLQSRFFRHILNLDGGFYRTHKVGDVMSRLSNDIEQVWVLYGNGLHIFVDALFLVSGAMVLMLRLDTTLTLLVLLPYPAILIFGQSLISRIYKTSKKVQEQLGALNSLMEEDLGGIAVIKSYDLAIERADNFSVQSRHLLEQNQVAFRVKSVLIPFLRMCGATAIAILFFVGGGKVIEGTITLGQLVEFHAYLLLLINPILSLGQVLAQFQRSKSSWARVAAILDTQPAIRDGSKPDLPASDVRGSVEFRNLTVSVDSSALVKSVSLKIEAGTSIAIVGRTGSGKSTLIATLPRLIGTPAGSVFLDGHDINELSLANIRSFIGYAPQEAFLFSTSIANNIRHGVEHRESPPKDETEMAAAIREAASAAGLDRDLEAFPDGLETVVGERGVTLSGGQRQRVALARCLATEPLILILDDSLSSVDAETEQMILDGLKSSTARRTAIIISHRLTAIRSADQIAVMEEGRLVELGSHDELVATHGPYFNLYNNQIHNGTAHGDS